MQLSNKTKRSRYGRWSKKPVNVPNFGFERMNFLFSNYYRKVKKAELADNLVFLYGRVRRVGIRSKR